MERTSKAKPIVEFVGRGRIRDTKIDWDRVPKLSFADLSEADKLFAAELVEDGMCGTLEEASLLIAALSLASEASRTKVNAHRAR